MLRNSNFENFTLSFLKKGIFLRTRKKFHISKTTKISAVLFDGNIRNLCKYSNSTQLQGWEFHVVSKKITKIVSSLKLEGFRNS